MTDSRTSKDQVSQAPEPTSYVVEGNSYRELVAQRDAYKRVANDLARQLRERTPADTNAPPERTNHEPPPTAANQVAERMSAANAFKSPAAANLWLAQGIREIERLQQQLVPKVCCGDFDNCRQQCIPLVDELRRRATGEPRADLIADAIQEINSFCDRTNTAWPTLRALRDRLAAASTQPPSTALREAVQILESGKELASVFHLRGAIIQALMKLHEQHPEAWPTATKSGEQS